MASSDFNRDDNLNQDEYVRFLNRLTQNQYSGSAFADFRPELQNNFESNAQSGEINIFGSKPGQSPSTAQSEFLDEFCVDTAIAIQAGGSGGTPPSASPGGGGTPTAQPQGGGGGPPTFSDALCRTAMATSDQNRDAYLNQEEFLFKEEGTYTLKMAAQLGTCVQYVEKHIQIYSDPDSIPVQTGPNGFSEILDFSLFPNPTDAPFEVIAEFEHIQTAQVRIYRDTGLLVESRNLNGLKRYREAFQLQDVPAGHYIAVLQTPTEYRTLNFIIQH